MNIIQYDDNFNAEELWALAKTIHETYPDFECLYIPKSVTIMENLNAEDLFAIIDKIWVALEKIKEERPEEYKEAYDNRVATIRDKQWKEVIKSKMKHIIEEIVKIVVCDRETGEVLMEGKPTTQPISITIINENNEQ